MHWIEVTPVGRVPGYSSMRRVKEAGAHVASRLTRASALEVPLDDGRSVLGMEPWSFAKACSSASSLYNRLARALQASAAA
jgi:hypothetical protein